MLMFLDVTLSVLLLYAAVTDWQRMEITNRCVLAAGVLGLAKIITMLSLGTGFSLIAMQLFVALMLFGLGFALFWLGVMGGGDVKLLVALGLYLNFSQLPLFLVVMSMIGGVLGLIALILRRKPQLIPAYFEPPSWLGCLKSGQSVVAYGLAIVPAALYVIWCA